MSFTEAGIPDQTGRVAIVTGSNTGIGFETARVLVERGARVVLACRDEARGDDAVKRIGALGARGTAELSLLDSGASRSSARSRSASPARAGSISRSTTRAS